MPNNNADNPNETNPPADDEADNKANNAPDKDADANRKPQPQVTTNPSIKNY
jgi:hypothetical protein